MEPQEMKLLVDESLKAWKSLGEIFYGSTEKEKKSVIFRRSIYVVKEIKKGEIFTQENLRVIRPGDGLKPKYYESILGRKAIRDIKEGTLMDWNLIK
jgi:N-acetylneuraminate synthase